MTVTLPKELTYLSGTSYAGGTYSSNGGGKLGTVTVTNNKGTNIPDSGESAGYTNNADTPSQATLTAVANADGTTTLTYVLKDVAYTSGDVFAIDDLHFACKIGTEGIEETDVKDGQNSPVQATIRCTEDYTRELTEKNNNLAITKIGYVKLSSASLYKIADHDVVEVGDDMGFSMGINNTRNAVRGIRAIDELPYIGDGASKFTGSLYVTELKLMDIDSLGNSSFKFYYTEDPKVRGKKSPDFTNGEIEEGENWKELEMNSDGTFDLEENFSPVAIACIGNLAAQKSFRLHVSVSVPEAGAGDIVENRFSNDNLSSSAYTYVVLRGIYGLTWLDKDRNGMQGSDEEVINGITVTLQKKQADGSYEDVKTIKTGEEWDRLTDTVTVNKDGDGHYRFNKLLSGTYRVVFSGNEDFPMEHYIATKVKAGSDSSIDSDGVGVNDEATGKLLKTIAETKSFVPAEEMRMASEQRAHVDSGFYTDEVKVSLSATKKFTGSQLKDGQFTFELKDSEGEVIEEVTNNANGEIVFKDLYFDEVGVYNYTIQEVKGKDTWIIFDTSVSKVKITVSVDGSGNLKADVDTSGNKLVFHNKVYVPEKPKQPSESTPNQPTTSKPPVPNTGINK